MAKSDYQARILKSGLTIYDEIPVNSDLRIPTDALEIILRKNLVGIDTENLAPRTRSKILKGAVCKALGYEIPKSFKKTQPRFPGQDLDLFIQKSRNLQIWNEPIHLSRRYGIVVVSKDGIVTNVIVLSGNEVQALDKTGKETSKLQAILRSSADGLLSRADTLPVQAYLKAVRYTKLISITQLNERLKYFENKIYSYSGASRERSRGNALQSEVYARLGYSDYKDNGQFPDLKPQLLEVKLQTARTIDLGLILPNSKEPMESLKLDGYSICPADIRYAIFDAERIDGYSSYRINRVYLVTGNDFFDFFSLMKGKGKNKKLQIPLPKSFFE